MLGGDFQLKINQPTCICSALQPYYYIFFHQPLCDLYYLIIITHCALKKRTNSNPVKLEWLHPEKDNDDL